jgi:predicted DNA repair protein MutK
VHTSSTEAIDPGGLGCGIADVPCHHAFNLGVTGASFFVGGSGFVYELIQFDRHNGVRWRARAASSLFSLWAVVAMLVATNLVIVRRS